MDYNGLNVFISPRNGRMRLGKGLVFLGDDDDVGQPSDVIQQILKKIDDETTILLSKFVVLEPDDKLPNAFALNSLSNGIVFKKEGGELEGKSRVSVSNLPNPGVITIAGINAPVPKIWVGTNNDDMEASSVLGEMMAEALLNVNRLLANMIMGDAIVQSAYPAAQYLVNIQPDGCILKHVGKKLEAAKPGEDFVDTNTAEEGRLCIIQTGDKQKFVSNSRIVIEAGTNDYGDILSKIMSIKDIQNINVETYIACKGFIHANDELASGNIRNAGILKFYDKTSRVTNNIQIISPDTLIESYSLFLPDKFGKNGETLIIDSNNKLIWSKSGTAILNAPFVLNKAYDGMDKAQVLSELGGGMAKIEATSGKISIAKAGKGLTDDYVDPNALKEALNEKDDEYKKIKEDCEKARDDSKDSADKSKENADKSKDSADKSEEAKTKVDETKEDIDKTKEQIDEIKKEIDEAKTEIEEKIDEIKTEIDEFRTEIDEFRTEMEGSVAEINASVAEVNSAIAANAEAMSDAVAAAAGSAAAAAGSAATALFLIGDVKNKEDKSDHEHDIKHLQSQINDLVPVSITGTPNEIIVLPLTVDKKLVYQVHLDSILKTNVDKSIAFTKDFDIIGKNSIIVNRQDNKFELSIDQTIIQPKLVFSSTEDITIQQEQKPNNEIDLKYFLNKDFKSNLVTIDKVNKAITENLNKINITSKNDNLVVVKGEPYTFSLETKDGPTTHVLGTNSRIKVTKLTGMELVGLLVAINPELAENQEDLINDVGYIIDIDQSITDSIDTKVDDVNARIDELNNHIEELVIQIQDYIDGKFDTINGRLDTLEDQITKKLDGVEVRQVIIEILKEYKLI